MTEEIVLFAVLLGSALTFTLIGVYARQRREPMWFWAGTTVDASEITDVPAYNRENGAMWLRYSLWFWLAALAGPVSPGAALTFLVLGCTVGIVLLVRTFRRIDRKYRRR